MAIRRIAWSQELDRGLARALPDELIRGIVASECRTGVAQAWQCDSEQHHALVVTRLDQNPTEWVVVAFEGSGMHVFGPLFIAAARDRGIPLRAHVTSPIVEQLLKRRLKLRTEERIMRYRP